MTEAELRVIDCLRDQSYSVGELADAIDEAAASVLRATQRNSGGRATTQIQSGPV